MGALGDVARTLPAQQALRAGYPDAHISWLVERKAAGLVQARAELDDVLVFPREELSAAIRALDFVGLLRRLLAVRAMLRSRRFDLVVDFHAILKSGVLSWLTGAANRVSYAPPHGREWGWIFANRRAQLVAPKLSRHQRNRALVEFLAVTMPERWETPVVRGPVGDHAAEADARESSPVLIHPGSSPGTPYKRYTVWGYGLVARRLADQGFQCWIAAGRGAEEAAFAQQIVEASEGRARLACETPELVDLCTLLAQARLFIGSDSGPLHLASLLGTPVVQIMGPTDPIENEPYPETAWRRARVPVACSPCRRGCADATCMKLIAHDVVLAAALDLLDPAPLRTVPASERVAVGKAAPFERPRSLSLLSAPAP